MKHRYLVICEGENVVVEAESFQDAEDQCDEVIIALHEDDVNDIIATWEKGFNDDPIEGD